MAAASIANIVKSSLGPVGLDKMLVDDIGVSARGVVYRHLVLCKMSLTTETSFVQHWDKMTRRQIFCR